MLGAIRKAIGSAESWAALRFPDQPWRFARESGSGNFLIIQPFDPKISPQRLRESSDLPSDGGPLPRAPQLNSTDATAHENRVAEAIGHIRSGALKKVVISRIVPVGEPAGDWTAVIERMEQAYPDAFVFVINHPVWGFWMGATPERLLAKDASGQYQTMALAGTRRRDEIEKRPWTEKEVEEQDLVRKHIVSSALNLGATHIDVQGPVDSTAGHLLHLRSDIRFNCAASTSEVARFLHPTPAVAGLPVDASLSLLRNLEPHNRGIYAGYIGWADNKAGDELLVILRCMQCWQNEAWLHVGGGITAASDPKAEWQETEDKAETLISVLRKQ